MIGYPISIGISENASLEPFTFITIIAHELSHIFLFSLRHPKKESEVFTDLTAMAMGFARVMDQGRKVVKTSFHKSWDGTSIRTSTSTYGYLQDDTFDYAYKKIMQIMGNQKSTKLIQTGKIHILDMQLENLKKHLVDIDAHLKECDIGRIRKTSSENFHQLGQMFRPDYFDIYKFYISDLQKKLNKALTGLNSVIGYSLSNEQVLNSTSLRSFEADIIKVEKLIEADLSLVKRCSKPSTRLKIFLREIFLRCRT